MTGRLCVLTVHAHPDDESSKGSGTIAKYAAQGVHTVLVERDLFAGVRGATEA